jgi:hypothetical protein
MGMRYGLRLEMRDLVELVRDSLHTLHEERRAESGCRLDQVYVARQIALWDAVLEWLKEQPAGYVDLTCACWIEGSTRGRCTH